MAICALGTKLVKQSPSDAVAADGAAGFVAD
jgi:hypothetical protein